MSNEGFMVSDSFSCNENSPIETFLDGMKRALRHMQNQASLLNCKLEMDQIYLENMPNGDHLSIYKVRSVVHEREGITGASEFTD